LFRSYLASAGRNEEVSVVAVRPADRRPLGRTGLQVSPVCIGTGGLAGPPARDGHEAGDNSYGGGAAEGQIGRALAAAGGLPPGFLLATKADADPATGDFSGERVNRSVEESLTRLGLDRVELMYLHDPEYHLTFAEAMAPGGPVQALAGLRDQGVLGHLGVAAGPVPLLSDFIGTGLFEVVLSHNRYTLIDRSAEPLMAEAGRRGMAFVNAAPFGGGILAKGPEAQPNYAYRLADEVIHRSVRAMQRACERHGVPLAAAALQFSVRDPRVTSTVVGVSRPSRIEEIVGLMAQPIPDDLWAELATLEVGPDFWLN
jgi:aryl-alcohol dehydrogenase-like predicted oxidoreductase